jgi:hypothetical protein
MTKEELLSLNEQWLEQPMNEAFHTAEKDWGLADTSTANR